MFENVDGRQPDDGVIDILIAHLRAFGSGELKMAGKVLIGLFQDPTQNPKVQCLLSTELSGPSGEKCNYILAADDKQHVHVIHQGEVVMTINTPTVVTAVCYLSTL